jgi:hypothetical protein
VCFASITLCTASQRVIQNASVRFVIDSVRKLLDSPSYGPTIAVSLPLAQDGLKAHTAHVALWGGGSIYGPNNIYTAVLTYKNRMAKIFS